MIYQKARELGELILNSEQGMVFEKAKKEFESNLCAKKLFDQYNELIFQEKNGILTEQEKINIFNRIQLIEKKIEKDPSILAFVEAQNEFNSFVSQILSILKFTVLGDTCERKSCNNCTASNKRY